MPSLSALHSSWQTVPHFPTLGDVVMQFVHVLVPVQQSELSRHAFRHTLATGTAAAMEMAVGRGVQRGTGPVNLSQYPHLVDYPNRNC